MAGFSDLWSSLWCFSGPSSAPQTQDVAKQVEPVKLTNSGRKTTKRPLTDFWEAQHPPDQFLEDSRSPNCAGLLISIESEQASLGAGKQGFKRRTIWPVGRHPAEPRPPLLLAGSTLDPGLVISLYFSLFLFSSLSFLFCLPYALFLLLWNFKSKAYHSRATVVCLS